MKIVHVVGARPNFMKLAPVRAAFLKYRQVSQRVIHTGQHYDAGMSNIFFEELGLPAPDTNLEVGSCGHAEQTAKVMLGLEPQIREMRPDLVLVYGDVNSTLATALVCSKLLIPVGHVEAGLRSFDRTMPEEVNRILTDQLSDLLFTPSGDGDQNLEHEGVPAERVHLVGNVMIDTLVKLLPKALECWENGALERLGRSPYVLVTLHRPSNVDDAGVLGQLLHTLGEIAKSIRVLFPLHPRTRKHIESLGLETGGLELLEPAGYLEFLALQYRASAVVTDSGGVQEETTFLGVPCLTVRENTERPVTVREGTNRLVGNDTASLLEAMEEVLSGRGKKGTRPGLWDGRAAERIASVVMEWAAAGGSKLRRGGKPAEAEHFHAVAGSKSN
ncbi:MAG: UDP-N-acetylglucosamine 2-epimerase (non-hydrolyzing) [Candidatus Acidiferrales bacterium]